MNQFETRFKHQPGTLTMTGVAREYFLRKKFGTVKDFRCYAKKIYGVDYEYHSANSVFQNLVHKMFITKPARMRQGMFILEGYNTFATEEARLERKRLIREVGVRYWMKGLGYGSPEEDDKEDRDDRIDSGDPIPVGEEDRTKSLYEVLRYLEENS